MRPTLATGTSLLTDRSRAPGAAGAHVRGAITVPAGKRDSTGRSEADSELQLSPASFDRFARFITAEVGIKVPDSKLAMITSRLLRRVRELGLDSLEDYHAYFFSSQHTDEERVHFIDAITTNKTDFFREPEHFEYLTGTVLARLSAATGWMQQRLNVWCAGCSSGEEPYTLAMVLSEHARLHPGFDFGILATDISTRVLDHARAGIYYESQIEPVPAALRKRYLLRSRDRSERLVRVAPELRRKVSFHRLNFMDASYPVRDTFDVIFFRNVMIYFDRNTQEKVVDKLCRHLVPGGYLFVGHSESLAGLDLPVTLVRASVFRKGS